MFNRKRAFRGKRAMDDELVPEDPDAAAHNGRIVRPSHLEGNPRWAWPFAWGIFAFFGLIYWWANKAVY